MPSIQHLNSSYKIYVSIYSFYQHNLLFNNAMTSEQYPTAVSGGCLCGCVRYRVIIPSSYDWRRGVIIMYTSNLHMLTCLQSVQRASAPNAVRMEGRSSHGCIRYPYQASLLPRRRHCHDTMLHQTLRAVSAPIAEAGSFGAVKSRTQ